MRPLLAFLLVGSSILTAQQYYPFSIGHSAGVIGAQFNPASIADSRYRFDLLFMGTSLNVSNNYIGARRELLSDFIRYQGDFPDTIDFRRTYLVDDYQNTSLKHARFEQQVLLPSFLLTLGRRSAIAFNFRMRNRFSLNNVDYRLAKLSYESLVYPPYWREWIDGGDLSFQYATYYDVALTYARVLVNTGQHLLKAGVTLRYLHGVYGAYFYTDNFKFRYQFYNDDSLAIQDGSRFYWGHAKDFDYDIYQKLLEHPLNHQTRFSMGGDVGLIYEFRPHYDRYVYDMDGEVGLERRDRDRYTLRLGVALQDIRSRMRFVKGPFSNQIEVTQNRLDEAIHEWNLRPVKFSSVRDFNDTLRRRFGIADSSPDFILRNQPVLNLHIDWHIGGPLYVGGLGVIPFGKDDMRLRTLRFFSIYPRIETPNITLGMPFTINEWGDKLWGAAVKLGPFVFGTNSLGWFLGQKTIRTIDFYFMFKAGIPYRPPRDKDKDGVSDKRDICPTVAGVWAFQGCPDSDGDHIPDKDDVCPLDPGVPKFQGCPDTDGDDLPDKEDACPTEAGLAKFKGCPDTDGDDIPDKDDACPKQAGLAKFKGCPDRDNDDIPDKDDECPTQAGLAQFRGCPDSDGDGIPDKNDACPTQAGLVAFQGCPDTDRDGIPDKEDSCPTAAGSAAFKGCPDSDEDGLPDPEDRCPTQAGPAENKGCPYADQDNDGVIDKEDDCPFTPGSRANRGCPDIPKEQKRILDMAFRNLEFETGKAIIRPRSFPYLDTLAFLLIENPSYRLKISGHTDNQGTLDFNLKLSKARAEAVRDYLISRGVSADRFIVEYFGPLRPIASNATPEGRARNRRVEMKVIFD
ncbi:MAG: OmpA family protein [Bacteroidia bacterium]|nr:OmpA family protein [Bacteroidia bacterium]